MEDFIIGSHQHSFEWYHPRPHTTSSSLDQGSQPQPSLKMRQPEAYSASHPYILQFHLRGKWQGRTGKGRQGRDKGRGGIIPPLPPIPGSTSAVCYMIHSHLLDENLQVQYFHLANDFVNIASVKLQYRLQLQLGLRSSVNSIAKWRHVKNLLNVHKIPHCRYQCSIP